MEKPLRILYHHRTAASDGMRVHIDEVIRALRDQGHVVRIVGPAAESAKGKSRLEAATNVLRRILPAAIFELLELSYNIPAYRRLAREARQFRPDILYERYNLYLLAGLWLKRRLGLPMILEVNSPLAAERTAFGNLRWARLARACETALWRRCDAVLPVTQVLAQQIAACRGVSIGIHVMPNGANVEAAPDPTEVQLLRRKLGLEPDHVVMGFVGFVRAWHGVGWALNALTELPPHVHLVVIGEGPAIPALEARAAELHLAARAHFIGRLPHHAIPAYIELFDIALQTASVAYASPLKLFEYMAHGRAIVAPDQPNIREILQDNINAILFSPEREDLFDAALARLCLDADLRERLGRQARLTIVERPLTWENNAARIAALGRALLTSRRSAAVAGVPASIAVSGQQPQVRRPEV